MSTGPSIFLRSWKGIALLSLLGLAVNAFLLGPSIQITINGTTDFMAIYSGTHLAFTGKMYDLAANFRVQREAAGWENPNRLFLRPPFDALLMWPLGQLPFLQAAYLWVFLLIGLTLAFCLIWPENRKHAAVVCCWSLPLYYSVADGQDVAVLLLAIALALRLRRAGRPFTGGMVISLCAIKFHLFLLAPLLFIRRRNWRFLSGILTGGAILTALSFLAGGANWPARYLALLRNPITNPWAQSMPNMHGLASLLPWSSAGEIVGTILVAALTWLTIRNSGFEYGLAAVLAGGILTAPHTYLSDCAMTIPALLIAAPGSRDLQRFVSLFALSPLACIWVIAGPAWITTLALLAFLGVMPLGARTTLFSAVPRRLRS